ncbi:hypothetical protein E2562_037465 [Oryza meyeriana var. granulata]|uniref:Uncharacterized protein n=1 Tax=Oryza meyeriana var. granulata TaxID=110450 RepID=A0A6G1DSW4_9ORYZ|nr:hypothetical protein E2562_037465 [Oryza meyeriana var. granulata]
MGRSPCCDKAAVKRGPWTAEEDARLRSYIEQHGTGGNWIALPRKVGLLRCGKSCRLRWLNYLRPDIRHGGFSADEDRVICALYAAIGSRWSVIAAHLPGRTDNDLYVASISGGSVTGMHVGVGGGSSATATTSGSVVASHGYDVFAAGQSSSTAATSYSSGVTAATELDEIFRSTSTGTSGGGDCSSAQSTDALMMNWYSNRDNVN